MPEAPFSPPKKYNFSRYNKEQAIDAVWQAVRFSDYHCESVSFASYIRAYAHSVGLKATIVVFPTFVVFKFYDPNSYVMPNMKAMPLVKELKRRHEEEAQRAWQQTPKR